MTTFLDFGALTDATTVANAFPAAIEGKTILITGVNIGGVAGATVEALMSHSPKLLILTGRSEEKVDTVIKKYQPLNSHVRFRFVQLDLASQKSVREAAKEVIAYTDVPQIDILINNAGVMGIQTRELSPEGIEIQFATNHVGHFLFTNLIMSKLIASARNSTKGDTRIINLSSLGHMFSPIRFSDVNFEKEVSGLPGSEQPDYALIDQFGMGRSFGYSPFDAYGQSKTANVLFSLKLNKRLFEKYGMVSYALHPGSIPTELSRNSNQIQLAEMRKKWTASGMVRKTLSQGASTTLVAALDPKLSSTGDDARKIYLSDCQFVDPTGWANDAEAADKLWTLSEGLVGQKFQTD